MPNDWNPAKCAANIANHHIDFAAAERFEWATSFVCASTHSDDDEVRLLALGMMDGKLHMLVFTIRKNTVWIISLRRASRKERKRYENENAAHYR